MIVPSYRWVPVAITLLFTLVLLSSHRRHKWPLNPKLEDVSPELEDVNYPKLEDINFPPPEDINFPKVEDLNPKIDDFNPELDDPNHMLEDLSKDADGFLPIPEAEELCGEQGWPIYPERKIRRKVYDLFIINTELDWLEIRLNELKDEVDYFVILESPLTFTGLTKPLLVKDHWDQLLPFHHQIIYQVLNETGLTSNWTWHRENFQRNALLNQVFPNLSGDRKANLGDVILVSDADEVPRPESLKLLRNCKYPRRMTLRSLLYYYSFQWLHRGPDWDHPQATIYEGEKTILPDDLRRSRGWTAEETALDNGEIWNASWHCSCCFATIEQMQNKLSSSSETDWNLPEFHDPARIVEVVRNGLDLYNRTEWEIYDRVESNPDIPEFVSTHKNEFLYMIDRDAPNANFRDYPLKEERSG